MEKHKKYAFKQRTALKERVNENHFIITTSQGDLHMKIDMPVAAFRRLTRIQDDETQASDIDAFYAIIDAIMDKKEIAIVDKLGVSELLEVVRRYFEVFSDYMDAQSGSLGK